jgi:ankyrin repeat protein
LQLTSLHLAVACGNQGVVEYLLSHGARQQRMGLEGMPNYKGEANVDEEEVKRMKQIHETMAEEKRLMETFCVLSESEDSDDGGGDCYVPTDPDNEVM